MARIRAAFRSRPLDAELAAELESHLSLLVEEELRRGAPPEEAERRARIKLGGAAQLREAHHEVRGLPFLDSLRQDLRYAGRGLRRNPAFSAFAILILGLGIGANTAMFSVMNVMLLRALPVKNPQELVEFIRWDPRGSMMGNLPDAVFRHLRQDTTALSGIFAVMPESRVFRAGGSTERATVHEVSGGFFSTLGVNALLGRTIAASDDLPGADHQVTVLSYPFWSRRFGRDPSVVGSTVQVNGRACVIIGVMPDGFFGVDRGELPDLWVPLGSDTAYWAFGRLKPGLSIPQAQAQLAPLFHRAIESLRDEMQGFAAPDREAFLAEKLLLLRVTTGAPGLRWRYWENSNTLKVLLGMTGLVLLIACVNLTNLLMARSAARTQEIGIRMAIGAGRRRILRQLLTENLLLALLGGAAGLLVAVGGHRLLVTFLTGNLYQVSLDFRLDERVLGFGLALSLLTGLASGLFPALRSVRERFLPVMQGTSRGSGAMRLPFARKLLAAQVALSMVLLLGAGLFVRSLRNLSAADLGLERQNLVMMSVDPSLSKTIRDRKVFWTQLTNRLAALAGVRSVGLAGDAVFGNGGWNSTIWTRQPDGSEQHAQIAFNVVSPGFFETVGIPLLNGREFGGQDQEKSAPVTVVNRAFALRFFPGQNPVGRTFRTSDARLEIVGIIGDAKYGNVREEPRPMFYLPLFQHLEERPYQLHVRTTSESAAAIAAIRHEIEAVDQDISIGRVRTISQVVHDLLQHDRLFAILAGAFGLLALLLTSIGIYGVVAYNVARRAAEIGLRMALGAQRSDVIWMVMRETLLVLAAGVALGLPAAVAAAHLLRSLLFGLGPSDPASIVWAVATLAVASAFAGFLPARRAALLSPSDALRQQ
jgi:predicted permease